MEQRRTRPAHIEEINTRAWNFNYGFRMRSRTVTGMNRTPRELMAMLAIAAMLPRGCVLLSLP